MAPNITIKATNITLTPSIKEYALVKASDLVKLINPKDTSAIVKIEIAKTTGHHKTGEIFRAEINLHIAGAQLYADATTASVYSSLDKVKDEMTRELKKQKEKQRAKIKKDGAIIKKTLQKF